MPFTSAQQRADFQRRFLRADDDAGTGEREGYRELIALGFPREFLQERAYEYWTFHEIEQQREELRAASNVARETAALLRQLIEKLQELNLLCGDHLDALDLGLDPELRRKALTGALPDLRHVGKRTDEREGRMTRPTAASVMDSMVAQAAGLLRKGSTLDFRWQP